MKHSALTAGILTACLAVGAQAQDAAAQPRSKIDALADVKPDQCTIVTENWSVEKDHTLSVKFACYALCGADRAGYALFHENSEMKEEYSLGRYQKMNADDPDQYVEYQPEQTTYGRFRVAETQMALMNYCAGYDAGAKVPDLLDVAELGAPTLKVQ